MRKKNKPHKIVVLSPENYLVDYKHKTIYPNYDTIVAGNIYIGTRDDGAWEVVQRDDRFKSSIGGVFIHAVETSFLMAYLKAIWHAVFFQKIK
jgi:hypothetical protein